MNVKQRCLLWIALFAGGAAALAQTNLPPAPEPKGVPQIQFDSTTYNFGRVKSGEPVKHDFVFINTGNATLEITDVKPGCGCTAAGTWDKTVEPGKTGKIPLQFNSTGFGGQVGKSATVTCNDPARTNLFLQITGTVWKPIDVTPAMAMFTPSSEAPTNETKVVKIVNNLDEPVTLSELKSSSGSFNAELKEMKPGKEFELHVTAVPPFTNPTVFATITLKTSSTSAPMVSVSAYAMVQQPVAVSPQQVMLPPGPLKTRVTSAVLVRNNTTNTFAVSDVRLDLPGVELKVNQPQTGRLYSITMVFPSGFELQSGQKPELIFKSTHPRFPEVKVPIVQMQRVAASAPGPVPAAAARQLQTASPLRPASPLRAGIPIPASPIPRTAAK
jgi:hypothetical protein